MFHTRYTAAAALSLLAAALLAACAGTEPPGANPEPAGPPAGSPTDAAEVELLHLALVAGTAEGLSAGEVTIHRVSLHYLRGEQSIGAAAVSPHQ